MFRVLARPVPASLQHQLLAINTNVPVQREGGPVYVFTASEYERVEKTTAEGDKEMKN